VASIGATNCGRLARASLQVRAEPDRFRVLERCAQPPLAFAQCQAAQILAGKERRIEREINNLGVAPGVERVLQRLKISASVGPRHHDFAVEPALPQAQRPERRGEMRQLRSPVFAGAREQA